MRIGDQLAIGGERLQPGAEIGEDAPVEPGADPARVAQTAFVEVADEERAEAGPAALRIGPAADHQLLLVDALELQPVRRATPHPVRRVGPLRDQALPAAGARLPQVLLTVADAVAGPYTLGLLSVIAAVLLPIVLGYQAWTYWVFRKRITATPVSA